MKKLQPMPSFGTLILSMLFKFVFEVYAIFFLLCLITFLSIGLFTLSFSFFFFTILFLPYSPSNFIVQTEYYIDLVRKSVVSYQITCTQTSTHYDNLLYSIPKISKNKTILIDSALTETIID